MKKLFLLSALFVFAFGFGQDSEGFDFKDLKNINSAKLFKKFCFEKEFSKVEKLDNYKLIYAQGYNSVNEEANVWAHYYLTSNTFAVRLFKYTNGSSQKSFDDVLYQVKKDCKFYDFKDYGDDEYICYSCPNSSFKGKIGFLRGKDGSDSIRTFDF
tara:strand:+ start:54 stop:521 length:468 start_codon:yes stop_codon:yes gene_type:complete